MRGTCPQGLTGGDSLSNLQELVEKEITQTEILHMECRETGEFAHRESTQYEQVETFNEEVRVDRRISQQNM